MDRKTVRFCRAKAMLRQVSLNGLRLTLEFRRRCRRGRNAAAGQVAGRRDEQAADRNPDRMLDRTGEQPAGQRADQDGDEGTGLDQRIAADQFVARADAAA
jgi:hypothetical protein